MTMSEAITPRRIEWAGPEGYVVVQDEDGVHLLPGRGGLEGPDLRQLLVVIAEAQRCRDAGTIPAPVPPPRSAYRRESSKYQARRLAKAASEAIAREMGVGDDAEEVPF